MIHLPEIWELLKKYLKREKWYDLKEIYTIVEIHVNLDADDMQGQSSNSKIPKWKRNVRNVLQYRKTIGEIQWNRNSKYMLKNEQRRV